MTRNGQTSYTPGTSSRRPQRFETVVSVSERRLFHSAAFSSDGGGCQPAEAQQCSGWRGSGGGGGGLQLGATPWSPADCGQQDGSGQAVAYSATPALATDVYMQTLCPSYTMLTYTHTPLLTNFGVRATFQTTGRVIQQQHGASLAL